MKAAVGTRIAVPGRHVGDPTRSGSVVEVHGADGGPPFVVRWDDGHEGTFVPGAEARVVEAPQADRQF